MSLSREEISVMAHELVARKLAKLTLDQIREECSDWVETIIIAHEVQAIAQQHMQQARISKLLGQGKGSIPWDD